MPSHVSVRVSIGQVGLGLGSVSSGVSPLDTKIEAVYVCMCVSVYGDGISIRSAYQRSEFNVSVDVIDDERIVTV